MERATHDPARAETVAIMQPYFAPYAGYFRLAAASDLFVIYDCVQFPRRGWVHRNRLPNANGELEWLTLPLEKAPRDILIRDLAFRDDAAGALDAQARRFPLLAAAQPDPHGLIDAFRDLGGTPVDYMERLLERAAVALGIPWRTVRSSSLGVPADLHAQDRIIAIASAVGARRYVNAPGGRELYEGDRFTGAGLELRFLGDYAGSFASILARLLQEPAEAVADEIAANTTLSA
ncbi:MAG: WbqC family protein [Pseudomonadota bacterium]